MNIVVCKECYDAGLGMIQPVYSKNEDGSGQHTCPNCLGIVFWHSSMGTLDLGIVRESELNPNDYVVFGEVFENHPLRVRIEPSQ